MSIAKVEGVETVEGGGRDSRQWRGVETVEGGVEIEEDIYRETRGVGVRCDDMARTNHGEIQRRDLSRARLSA